jgi:hypothetical protein
MHRHQRPIIVLLALLLMLSALACSLGSRRSISPGETAGQPPAAASPTTASPTTAPQEAATSTPAASQETATPTPLPPTSTPLPTATAAPPTPPPASEEEQPAEEQQPPPPPGSQPLDVAQIPELKITTINPKSQGLSELGTFRQRVHAEFSAADSAYSGVYHYEGEINTAAKAIHATLRAEGEVAQLLPANQLEVIWIDTRLWIKVGNRPWMPVPENTEEFLFQQDLAAGSLLPYARQFERVQPDETVNGVLCAHYTYDAQDLPTEGGTVSGHGDVYVALNGGYVVRYTLQATGTFDNYFQGPGTLNLTYDTYDVGAPIDVQPPRR